MMSIMDLPPSDSYPIGIYRTMAEIFGPDCETGVPVKTSSGVDCAIDGFRVHFEIRGVEIYVPFYEPLEEVGVAFREGEPSTPLDLISRLEGSDTSADILSLYTYLSPEMREWIMATKLSSKYGDGETPLADDPWGDMQEQDPIPDAETEWQDMPEGSEEGVVEEPKFANETLMEFWNALPDDSKEKLDVALTEQVSILGVGAYNGLFIELTIAGLTTPVHCEVYLDGTINMAESDWLVFPELLHLKRVSEASAQTDEQE